MTTQGGSASTLGGVLAVFITGAHKHIIHVLSETIDLEPGKSGTLSTDVHRILGLILHDAAGGNKDSALDSLRHLRQTGRALVVRQEMEAGGRWRGSPYVG